MSTCETHGHMKKIKIADLVGVQLDYAVANAIDYEVEFEGYWCVESNKNVTTALHFQGSECVDTKWSPSTRWGQGGPLIDRYTITVSRGPDSYGAVTSKHWWSEEDGGTETRVEHCAEGETMLVAAMRALLKALVGEEVEIPESLV